MFVKLKPKLMSFLFSRFDYLGKADGKLIIGSNIEIWGNDREGDLTARFMPMDLKQ